MNDLCVTSPNAFAGQSTNGGSNTPWAFALAKFDDTGELVAQTTTEVDDNDYNGIHHIALSVGGEGVVVAGFTGADWSSICFAVASYDEDLSLNWLTKHDIGSAGGEAASVAVAPDGKVLVTGSSASDLILARYDQNGTLDTSFGSDGHVTITNGGTALAVGPDGKIVVGGASGSDFDLSGYKVPAGLEERLYVQQDANWNVTSVADRHRQVTERHVYDAYGTFSVYDAASNSVEGGTQVAWRYLFHGGRYREGERNSHAVIARYGGRGYTWGECMRV